MSELRVIAIGLTNRCNLACSHCGRLTEKETMTGEQPASFYLTVLEEARTLGAQQVNLTGGEIFCRPDCIDLIAGAYELGYFVSLETNGTLLTDDRLDQLVPFADRLRISFSLDGLTAATHDIVRGAGAFDKTERAILAAKARNLNVRIITVLNQRNLSEIPAMVTRYARDLDLGFRLIPNMMQYGRGVYACNDIGVPYDQAWKMLTECYFPFLIEANDERHSVELNPALVPLEVTFHHVCPWGLYMIGIGPTGIVSLCHVSNWDERFIFGDLTISSLTEIWTSSPALERFRSQNPDDLLGICGNCLARTLCRGGCRLHAVSRYGDLMAPDPQCQDAYNNGQFPAHAIEDDARDCTYTKKE